MKAEKLFSITSALAAGLLAVGIQGVMAQTSLYIENPGFEQPASGKIQGFDVSGQDIPGWMDAGPSNADSGVEPNGPFTGLYPSWCRGEDSGAYQITTNVMGFGNKYTLTWYEAEIWGGSVSRTALIRADATNTPAASCTELAVSSHTLGYTWAQVTLVYIAGAADAGKYLGIRYSNTGPSGGSWSKWDDFTLTEEVGDPSPQITTHPVSQWVYEGDSATFTAAATGPDLSFQWKAGVQGSGIYTNVPGATNTTLTIPYAQATADYVFVVTNVTNSATSSPATLTVIAATYVNGLFNGDFELPATGKINAGFDVEGANNVPGWRNAGPNQNDTGIESPGSGHSGSYAAYLHRGQSGAYQISTNVLQQGDSVTLTWHERDSWQGVNRNVSLLSASTRDAAFGSTTILMAVTNEVAGWWAQKSLSYVAGAGDAGKYLGVAFQSADPATANGWAVVDDFSLTITPPTAAPGIITPPASHTAWLASITTFTVVASGNGLSYQWQAGAVGSETYTNIVNGGRFSGADSATLTITNVAVENALDYVVIVTNAGGSITSSPAATLTVNLDAPYMGTIASKTVNQYENTTLSPSYVAGATSYQWMAGAVGSGLYTDLVNGGRFSGVDTAILSISNVQPQDGLDYVLVASNVSGSTTNEVPATLTVIPIIYLETFTTTNSSIVGIGWVADARAGMYNNIDGGLQLIAYDSATGPQAFYTTKNLDTGSTGFAFPSISLASVSNLVFSVDNQSWWQPFNMHTYLAVQMNGGQWYVSTAEFPQAGGSWATYSMTLDTNFYTWNELTVSGTGGTNTSSVPLIGGAATTNLSGHITGAGLVVSASVSSYTVFDSFKITGDGFIAVPPVNTTPTNLISSLSGGMLTLSWPADHTGWRLITQTNALSVGLQAPTNLWFTVPGSTATNSVTIETDPTQPTVFYRLIYP